MSPLLTKDTKLDNKFKFVRDGERIAFEKWQMSHADIAEQHNLGEQFGEPGDFVRRRVDDAGYVSQKRKGVIVFSDNSNTCILRDGGGGRGKTKEIAERILGKTVEIE